MKKKRIRGSLYDMHYTNLHFTYLLTTKDRSAM